jgi:poly(ADP-ribose) glycohydrolase ARH3
VHALDSTPAQLRSEAILFALPTHAGSVGVAAAVAMACGVALLARLATAGHRRVDPVEFTNFLADAIRDLEPTPTPQRRPPGTPAFLRDRIREIPSWLDRIPRDVFEDTWTGAFALESVPAAIYAFLRTPDDPREVLVTAANASHDTDTIASMAGNLAGAWLGADRLQSELGDWLSRLEDREELEELGRRLASLSMPA